MAISGMFWARNSSLNDDEDNNNLLESLMKASAQQDIEDEELLEMMESYIFDDIDDTDVDDASARVVQKHCKRSPVLEYFDNEGNIVPVPPTQSPWYKL